MKRLALCLFAVFANSPLFAGEPDLSSPAAAVRSYLAATKANDLEAAKKCWTIDDDNASGALDVMVGMWISSRQLVSATESRFGADGLKLLGRWVRPTCTDKAIDLTLDRLGAAEAKERDDEARLTISWQPGDGEANPAFLYLKAPLFFRRAGDRWRLDANVFTGAAHGADLFGPDKLWPIWRDEMAVMNDLTAGLEKDKFKDVAEFERELKKRVEALKAKYERKD